MAQTVPTDAADFRRWLSGIPYEVAFWRSYYGNRRRRADLAGWSLYGKPCVLDGFDIDSYMRACGDAEPVVLDVGCALSYAFGNIINGKPADVRYVDPLAPFYNRILKRYGVDRPAIAFGMIESLSGSFAAESVNFVHVRNALDHCADPVLGIVQCLVVLKAGGVLYLNHFVNEAEREGYRGFHQFNITEDGGDLIIWNPQGRTNITELCRGWADVRTMLTDEGRVDAHGSGAVGAVLGTGTVDAHDGDDHGHRGVFPQPAPLHGLSVPAPHKHDRAPDYASGTLFRTGPHKAARRQIIGIPYFFRAAMAAS